MSTWPKSGEALRDEGYRSTGQGRCRGCNATIIWVTTPAGKPMPMSILGKNSWQPHFVDCPQRDRFKKKKEKENAN